VRPPEEATVFVTETLNVKEEVLTFVAESANEPDATVITAVPPDERDPVKVAVYVLSLPVKPVRVPNVAETSAEVNVVVDSLTVNVTVVVEPDATEAGLAPIDTVGAPVS
jgi:hypothetical protein